MKSGVAFEAQNKEKGGEERRQFASCDDLKGLQIPVIGELTIYRSELMVSVQGRTLTDRAEGRNLNALG